jgi:hypothetical protein
VNAKGYLAANNITTNSLGVLGNATVDGTLFGPDGLAYQRLGPTGPTGMTGFTGPTGPTGWTA